MQKIIQALFFTVKKIQINLTTLKNRIEIAVAYTIPGRNKARDFRNIRKMAVGALVLAGVAGISLVAFRYHGVALSFFSKQVRNIGTFVADRQADIVSDAKDATAAKKIGKDTAVVDTRKVSAAKDEAPDTPETVDTVKIDTILPKPKVPLHALIPQTDSVNQFFIVANKAFKVLYLLQRQHDQWLVVKEYDIAIGQQQGQKTNAGDKRTPEGQYFIVGRKERAELNEIYGPLSYVLNYPNEEDKKAGRTGQGIWIHGTDPDSLPLETRGCLEMKNDDLSSLSKILRRGIGIPVLVLYNDSLDKPATAPVFARCEAEQKKIVDNYNKTAAEFQKFIIDWKTAWETKKFDVYASFYDTIQFKGQGLDWAGWRERKLHTFDLYDTIAITINDIMITDYSEMATVVKFYQVYKTNLNHNDNAKKLLIEKVNDSWKIISESTCSKEELLL